MMIKQFPWQQEGVICHSQRLLQSFQHWIGKPLLDISGSPLDMARSLFEAPFVLVSHGTEPDPIFNYGNQRALDLWQLDWEQLTQMPSRYTAEAIAQEERDRLLAQTHSQGFISNYRGVRISSKGQRFLIENAIVWNVLDEQNQLSGQAAVFSEITPLS